MDRLLARLVFGQEQEGVAPAPWLVLARAVGVDDQGVVVVALHCADRDSIDRRHHLGVPSLHSVS
jgi:hypothetical protein